MNEITWTGRNRRDVIGFLGYSNWMGFTGQMPEKGKPDLRTVEIRDAFGAVRSVKIGQRIVACRGGGFVVEGEPTHA